MAFLRIRPAAVAFDAPRIAMPGPEPAERRAETLRGRKQGRNEGKAVDGQMNNVSEVHYANMTRRDPTRAVGSSCTKEGESNNI